MSFLEGVPKEPRAAFRHVLTDLQEIGKSFPANGQLPSAKVIKTTSLIRMLQAIYSRVPNSEDYRAPIKELLGTVNGPSPSKINGQLSLIEDLLLANSFDDHFIDEESEDDFNRLHWSENDRSQVIKTLAEARNFISFSADLKDGHKRRILFWISKAESEVFREKGGFATVMAATSEILDMTEVAGEKGKPLAKLIQTVRTTTKRNVNVHQLEGPDKQKQISPPTPGDE